MRYVSDPSCLPRPVTRSRCPFAFGAGVRLCALLLLLAGLAQAGPYDTWGKYKTLTINTTNNGGGANVSGTVTNFPVLIRINSSTAEDILDEALANGADVRFASSDGSTALSYQIERWSTSGAWIWVLVPSIAGNSTTDIRVYWLKTGQSDASSASTVFATSNSFATVWHLNESPGAGANGFADASGSGNTGTAQAGASTDTVTAVSGKGYVLNGSSKYVSSATSITNSPSTFTVSAWFKSTTGSGGKILGMGTAQTGSSGGYDRHIYMANDGKIYWGINKNNSGTLTTVASASSYNDGNWHLATGRLSASGMFLYVDGTQVGTDATVTSAQTNASAYWRAGYDNLNFWGSAPSSYWFNGSLDEVVISTTARSVDWIKLAYQTQRTDVSCILYGTTQASTFYWNRNDILTSSTDLNKAYNWSVNADGTGRRAYSSADDDFTSTTLGGSWTCQDSDNNTGTGTCDVTSNYGQMTILGRGSDWWTTTNEFTALKRSDITGDFDVTVKVVGLTNTNGAAKAGIYMANSFTSLSSGGLAGIAVRADSKVELLAASSTLGQLNSITITAASVNLPVWLRLVKSGTSVTGYYRTSYSATWTNVGGAQTPLSTNANSQIALGHTAHSTTVTGEADFDEFQGGFTLSSDQALSFNGTGSAKNANATLTGNLSAASVDVTNYTGTLGFGSYTLSISSGNAVFGNSLTVSAGTGTLAFTGSSGTQVLTPPSGKTLPAITSTGAATLQLSTNDLTCVSYSQTAGTLDFNGKDITTTGNFTLTSGTSTSFSNLSSRTITVGGNASFTGSAGNLVNLNQGAWTLAATGTLTADYANISGSDASEGTQGVATHSYNGRTNTNWLFSVPTSLSLLTKSVRLNFNTTSSGGGANVSGNVANFPLFLRFTSSNLTFSASSDSGTDLIFVDKDGSTLYHQVVEWDKANKVGKVWVKVPQVDGNSTTDYITLYYGCDSCTTNPYASSDQVFSVFKSVYHLNAPEAKAYDATTLANHGTFVSNLANLANGGITSKNAAVFDGTANSYIDIPNESNYDLTTNLSVWAWVKVGSFNTAYQSIVTKANNTFRLTRHNTSNFLYFACTKTSSTFQTGGAVNVNDGNWHLAVGTYDGSNVKLYVDGAQDGSSTALTGSIDVNNNDVYIGENGGSTGTVFNGSLSEVRIGNTATALSSDFIKLSYETQKASSTFLTAYTTASFQNSKVFKLNTTASGANITGTVTNFPLLLRITGVTALGANNTGTTVPTDIRFLDDDGVTWLDYQIERWDRTGGIDSGEVWVKVPTIEGNYAGHTITMYYKQASGVSVVDGQCASCVFPTSNNFVADWHFNTSGTGTRPDATSNSNSLTTNNYSGSEFKGGIIAGADSLNGSNQYLNAPSGMADWSNGFTYTGWAYWSSTGSYARLFDFGNGSTADNVYSGRSGTSTNGVAELYNNTTSGGQKTTTGTIATGVWGHFAVTVSGTTIKQYKNGVLASTATSSQSLRNVTRTNNYLGKSNWVADAYYQGKFDEVAIANTVRDSNWIQLCYQNQRRDANPLFNPSPADFVSTQKYTFNTTKTGANVTANVTDFPLLVRITGSTILDAVEGSGTSSPPDIRFLDADGKTWLNYVVERWTRTTDSAEVWVQVPQIDGNSDHDYITLYYNSVTNGAVPNGECGSCIFGSANGFTGTWHMDDSTTNQNVAEVVASQTGTFRSDVTNENTSANGHTATGIIGRSLDFQGGASGTGGLTQKNNFTHTLQWPKTTGTISHWIKPDAVRDMMTLYESDGTSANYNGLGLAADLLECHLGIDGSAYGLLYQDGNNVVARPKGGTPAVGTWAHVAATWDRNGYTYMYVNGAKVDSVNMSSLSFTSKTPTVMQVGRVGDATDNRHWDGTIDEIEVSNVARSADWMKLAYETQRRSGNVFWNNRVGPNNTAILTATATSSGNISLSWPSTVSDSSTADSVGIWVRYSGSPDSVGSGSTFVAKLAKADTTYAYPATYSATYWFSLAVRNTSGQWSPFTSSSSDSATLSGVSMPDTIYVDSATGLAANSCASARNPSTPKKTIKDALTCGAQATDTLVVRVMPGTYTDSAFSITTKPSIVTSFDNNSRAIMYGAGTATLDAGTRVWTLLLYGSMGIRNLDIKCKINGYSGVYVTSADNVFVEGCRIYNGGAGVVHGAGIEVRGGNSQHHFANNLIYQPTYYGILMLDDNSFNVVNNTFVGSGGTSTGFYQFINASAADATVSNNIFYNWGTGIGSFLANIGSCANNLFFGVTTGQNTATTTCTGSITRDPLFANTTPTDRNSFKLLPGSPAIDAGTTTYGSGAQACTRRTPADYFGTARPIGTAPDIGFYEGTGYTPNPSGEFDSLAVTSTATTVTVQNSKWKLVWDKGRGAGITEFYDKTTAPSTNLLVSNSLLFDAKIDSYTASSQTGTGPVLYLLESSRARAVIRQQLPVSASLDLNIYYSVYSSGHIYIESELSNLASATTTVGTVDYTLKLASTTAAFTSADSTKGFGYLTTATRDAMLTVTRDLDGGASGAERWSTSTAATGATGTVIFKTTDLADLSRNTLRRHDFLLYMGDNALTFDKAAVINADAYSPSALSMSAGSLLGERSWQEGLQGHWTLDDGAGSTARDKSVNAANNATLGGANYKWVSGKVGAGLYLTTTDSAYVASATGLNPANGFTVMFWLKPDFANMGDTAMIVSKGNSNASGWYCRKVTSVNKILFNMGGTTVTSPTLTDLAWTHIALLADAGSTRQLEIYVNGVQCAASTASATATSNSANLVFGYASPGATTQSKFKGTLDDIRIYGREMPGSDIQSIYDFGFSSKYGQYALRADNNNRVVALINGGAAQTRVQPAFYISNWFGPRNPRYVFLNGTKLAPNTDYVVDSVNYPVFGSYLTLQLNKILTDADQTLFIDDDDSTGFMGNATAMKSLTISATASDKIVVKNFSDTVFGSASSGQWYMELGLKGWLTPTGTPSYDSSFGEIKTWKAAAINPSVAISSASQLTGFSVKSGRGLSYLKLDARTNEIFSAGKGYASPAALTYTLVDSSSTRLSLTLSAISLSGTGGTATLTKRYTFYPTGRVFVSFVVSSQTGDFDTPRLDLSAGYDGGNPALAWAAATSTANARCALIGGDANFHSIGMAILSLKNNTAAYTTAASLMSSASFNSQTGSTEQTAVQLSMPTSLWTAANKPVTLNYMMDFSRDFTDSATALALLKDSQTPAVLTAITGARVTNDALDFNADNFAEADGAYTYAASSGIAHFRFVNTVTSYNPAFRISSWTQGTLPEFVVLDNQVLTKGYQYNAYLNTTTNEVVMQFNKTLTAGTHVIYISHKSGLAVKLNRFEAKGGDGVDSLTWATESEFENLGFHVWRREVPSDSAAAKESARVRDSLLAEHGVAMANDPGGAGGAAKVSVGDSAGGPDTLPSLSLNSADLARLGYVRITPKLIPGAQGGSSASTREYLQVDRTAAFGKSYEYLLEAIDFNDGHVFYGPRAASPGNPYNTEILPNYPNPFNPITTMRFSLREKLKLSLVIYDARGRVVRTLIRPEKPWAAGKYTLIWDAHNDLGIEVSSGQYFYRFTAGRYVKARKMILLK
jgi:hypothetical protein